MTSRIVLKLAHGPGNPRNSEGAFVTLADGRILYAYSRYYGESWSDHAAAEIAARYSADGGRTWTAQDRILVPNEGGLNVMSVSLLRLHDGRIALFYLRKNSENDCRTWMRTSQDEGQSWSEPVLCLPAPGYFVVNNDRVVQLGSGRLVVPAAFHRAMAPGEGPRHDGRAIALFYLSDDAGATWRESADWRALPVRSGSGLQEPGVVELKGGRLYAWCRTTTGRQWEMQSRDGGETWSEPRPSRFRAPCSPLCIKRIPATGNLLAVWNDHSPRWKLPAKARSSWGRTPLACALSGDEGRSWRRAKLIEKDPRRGFCYTAIHCADGAVLLAYCCGGRAGTGVLQDTCIRRVPMEWLYG